jgi:hypothetical protein
MVRHCCYIRLEILLSAGKDIFQDGNSYAVVFFP